MGMQTLFAFDANGKTYVVLFGVNKNLPINMGQCLPALYSVYEWISADNCFGELSGFFSSTKEIARHYDLSDERCTALQLLDAYKLQRSHLNAFNYRTH